MALQSDKGYWRQCNCCPYGYHIDLDFVRYCESIQHIERSGSFKRRKDRRRQRQSMEVLLGLINPVTQEPPLPIIDDVPGSPIQEALVDVVSDFEKTLQRSKHKLSHNLPDVTAVSGEGPGARDFDAISIESCGLSPAALHNIREQMALSLERTKELEELVRMIPALQGQIETLEDENKHLMLRLRAEEESNLNRLNSNYLYQYDTHTRNRSASFNDSIENGLAQRELRPKRDFGVMASVLTRNVGVGHQTPHTKTVSTATAQPDGKYQHVDRWLNEKCKFLNGNDYSVQAVVTAKVTVSKETQTSGLIDTRGASVQTVASLVPTKEQGVQIAYKSPKKDTGVSAVVTTKEFIGQASPETVTTASSEDTTDEILCENCKVLKSGFHSNVEGNVEPSISLATLSATPRSKSFHLGQTKINVRHKTVACQYESRLVAQTRSSQTEVKTTSKYSQHDVVLANKSMQSEFVGQSKSTDTENLIPTVQKSSKTTDTKGLGPLMKHKSSEIAQPRPSVHVACNTIFESNDRCSHCYKRDADDASKKEDAFTPSRIPRLQIQNSPTESRKFKRQDTYTKIPVADKSPTSSSGLAALELLTSKTVAPEVRQIEKVKQKYKLADGLAKVNLNGSERESAESATTSSTQITTEEVGAQAVSETVSASPPKPETRKKCVPSKEMQAAMKVLNDSLQKNKSLSKQGQLKNANAIVESEWFRISSVVNADPLDVEDYLDSFEDISSVLLQYIVNMVDGSGNTAMHYAVSHGNFDVVSILLDSKVCDINKQNKAGYTSVMLVSLAEVRSHTHADVVRRLFSLADVNIRAKQHGQTALMLAVSHGRLDMVTMLLEAGADINIQDEDGSTALMCAAEHGHFEIVKYFLSQPDCDSTICDVDGSTALKIAMEAGHRHIGVQLYAHERNIHGAIASKPKKTKSASASPKMPSSPLMQRSVNRALPTNK